MTNRGGRQLSNGLSNSLPDVLLAGEGCGAFVEECVDAF